MSNDIESFCNVEDLPVIKCIVNSLKYIIEYLCFG